MRVAITLALAFTFVSFCAFAQEQSKKPKVSTNLLTDEQLAVYRAVLKDYTKDSPGNLNLSSKTYPMKLDEGCAKGIKPERMESVVLHAFTAALTPNVTLVDPEQQETKIKQNDPQNLAKRAIDKRVVVTDKQLNESVELAFSTGLFSFSEIIFDKGHRHAVVAYSFECGSLCGHGNNVVLIRTGNKWKVKGSCGASWIS